MARYGRLLTDAQWEKIRPLLPKWPRRPQGGRPPSNDRKVLEGILWIFAKRRSLAGFARRVSLTGNVLVAASRLGRARGLARHLACIPGGVPALCEDNL